MTPSANKSKVPKILYSQSIVEQEFFNQFSAEPSIVVSSPGRINLIGEHTDYNNGFVLPAAIDKQMNIAISRRDDDELHFYAPDFRENFNGTVKNLTKSHKFWPNYINGVIKELIDRGFRIDGLNLVVGGDIPAGAGLSSSAALECSVVFALNEMYAFGLSKMDMVKIARAAENNFVGLQCGIMDMFASMFGKKDHAILLDCRSLKYEYIPLDFHQHAILLMDTRVKHSLATGEYNVRREQCEMGVRALRKIYPHVNSLRDANRAMIEYTLKDRVPDLIYTRCKYVVEENLRLQVGCEALRRNDLVGFGKKMYASHAGLSKLYDVSCPELDYLVDLAKDEHAIIGARMMGGGFGGCTINIIRKSYINEVVERMSKSFVGKFGQEPLAYICNISEGTHVVSGG
ncbi:galactokinase [Flavihumibacter profundi]|jgi:galactokinase|uniref:galactokinase n=1 Tax=Flavihumibacter profundi TaxID=2716883 RepID=UPI001CC486EA|nr:galactokinase [Flavihumibacter profundi]MBZ5856315.1 galactokinase [Flavihumibacter profundi]